MGDIGVAAGCPIRPTGCPIRPLRPPLSRPAGRGDETPTVPAQERVARLCARGRAANDAGQPARAARHLQAALQLIDTATQVITQGTTQQGSDNHDTTPSPTDSPERAALTRHRVRALLSLSLCEFERAGLAAAETVLDAADNAAAQVGDPLLIDMCRWQRAGLLARSGHLRRSMACFEATTRPMAELGVRDHCVILLTRGMARLQLDDLAAARQDFTTARQLASANGLVACEFMALHNLGYAEYVAGNLPAALALMDAAGDMDVGVSRAPATHDHGRVLLEAGLIREGVEMLKEARQLCSHRRQRHLLAEIEVDLARAYTLLGDVEAARRCALAARTRFRRHGTPALTTRAELLLLAVDTAAGRRASRVAESATAVAAELAEEGDATGSAEAALLAAQAYARLGRWDEATDAMPGTEGLAAAGSLSTRMRLALVRTQVAQAAGEHRHAVELLRGASRELGRAHLDSSSLDVRSAVALHGVALAELDVSLALNRGADAVYLATERWRAPSARLPAIRPPKDPLVAEQFAVLRRIREQLRAGPGAEEAHLTASARRLEASIRQRGWSHRDPAAHGVGMNPLPLAQLRAALADEDTDLVSFFVHRADLFGCAVLRGRPRVQRLTATTQAVELVRRVAAALQAAASVPAGPLHRAVWGSLRADLSVLDAALLAPFRVDSRRLVVLPSRLLATLPWGMMPSRAGAPTTLARSATSWATARTRLTAPIRVFAGAGPDLRAAADETARVARSWGAGAHSSPRTEAATLRNALQQADLVHVAAHGTHNEESPFFSSVQMSDGPLFTHELQQTGVSASHVVLSACDVGRSTVAAGEEPLGLTSSLLALGASCVVAAVCRVPDQTAAEAMTSYHTHLAAGLDAAEALARAAAEQPDTLAGAFIAAGSSWRCVPTHRDEEHRHEEHRHEEHRDKQHRDKEQGG